MKYNFLECQHKKKNLKTTYYKCSELIKKSNFLDK